MSLRLDPVDPTDMEPEDRLDEIASILARGILRLHGRVPPPRICRNPRRHALNCPHLLALMASPVNGERKEAMRGVERRPDGKRAAAHDRDRAAAQVRRGLRRADALVPQGVPRPPNRVADSGQRGGRAPRPGAEGRRCGSHASPALRAETNDSHGFRFHGLRAAAARRHAARGYRLSPLRSEEAVSPTPTPPTLSTLPSTTTASGTGRYAIRTDHPQRAAALAGAEGTHAGEARR